MPLAARVVRPTSSGTPRRVSGIDAARTVAALGTVWVHCMRNETTDYLGHLGRFSVPFFAFIAAWFLVARVRSRGATLTLGEHAFDRFNRLYVPFLYWTAAYLLLRHVKQWAFSGMGEPQVTTAVIVAGSQPHLWFLPFLCACLILAYPFARWGVGNRKREILLAVMFIVIGAYLTYAAPGFVAEHGGQALPGQPESFLRTVANWTDRLPAFMWGLSLGFLLRRSPASARLPWAWAPACFTLWIGSLLWMTYHDHSGGIFQNMAGMGLLSVALLPWPTKWIAPLAAVSVLSYGVYLDHMIFTEMVRTVREAMGWERTFALDIVRYIVSLTCSFGLAWLLRKWWLTRPMVP